MDDEGNVKKVNISCQHLQFCQRESDSTCIPYILHWYTVRLIQEWLHDNGIKTLNVAGPRVSGDPAIYDAVVKVLELVFKNRK